MENIEHQFPIFEKVLMNTIQTGFLFVDCNEMLERPERDGHQRIFFAGLEFLSCSPVIT